MKTQCAFQGMSDLSGSSNRSFRYGDGLFETIKVRKGIPLFLDAHYHRLLAGMKVLQFKGGQCDAFSSFKNGIEEHLKKNVVENARLRLQLFRSEGGYYTPVSDTYDCVIHSEPQSNSDYLFAQTLKVGIYTGQQKVNGALSSIKSASALLYVVASIDARNRKLDDCLLLNSEGNVIESSRSNVFMVKNEIVQTPPLSEGCVDGVMRKQVLQLLLNQGQRVIERPLTVTDIKTADEVFLTNVIQGVQAVSHLDGATYPHKYSEMLCASLNEALEVL
ncbi:MAG TPA: aminotransferase class IV [Bacteroidia bacterium]|nr:aminotransferase class IV [Bacteroidia bacterium]